MKNIIILLLMLAILSGCGKKKMATENIIIGNKTYTINYVNTIKIGDTLNTLKRSCFLLAAIQKNQIQINDSSIITDLQERLELESGHEWNSEGVKLLYSAAKFFKTSIIDESKEPKDIFTEINSLLTEKYQFAYTDTFIKSIPQNIDTGYTRSDLELFFSRMFYLDEKTSKILLEFLFISNNLDNTTTDVNKIVSGLVFDSTSLKKKHKKNNLKKVPKKITDNSKDLIKFRSLESIKDSISAHAINIQSIYKKTLKIHEGISGVVYVKFIVDEPGKVVQASISRSELKNKELHENLMSYVRNIKFKAIPEGKGNMTFDFPFEFRPE